jgi:hypothetical protein
VSITIPETLYVSAPSNVSETFTPITDGWTMVLVDFEISGEGSSGEIRLILPGIIFEGGPLQLDRALCGNLAEYMDGVLTGLVPPGADYLIGVAIGSGADVAGYVNPNLIIEIPALA